MLMILFFLFPVAAIVTGSYPLLLESQDGKYLGDTTVTYYDDRVRKMVHAIALNPCLQSKFFNMCMHSSLDGSNEHTGDETQSSGSLGKLVLIFQSWHKVNISNSMKQSSISKFAN